jgi:hypothetical protein
MFTRYSLAQLQAMADMALQSRARADGRYVALIVMLAKRTRLSVDDVAARIERMACGVMA